MKNLRIFGLGGSVEFAEKVIKHIPNSISLSMNLGVGLSKHHEERRPDGEAYTTSLENVRGCDVYVITSLYGDDEESVDEKLIKTLIFINTLRHASAARITLLAPYLCYMRQDRKTESRAPIATQAVAMMLEVVGMNRLLTMDVHNLGAEQNAFRVPIDNLEARKMLADAVVKDIHSSDTNFKVLSPDAGGTGRAKAFAYSLGKRLGVQVEIVHGDKTRINPTTVKTKIIGDVAGCNVIAVDDMISTGKTILEAYNAVEEAGGKFWGVVATHPLLVDGAFINLEKIPRIYVTNTMECLKRYCAKDGYWQSSNSIIKSFLDRLKIVDVAPMFAEAITRTHLEGGSISQLLND